MINTITGVGDSITLKVVKREGKDREKVVRVDSKDGEGVVGVGDVGVQDALREFHDHKFTDGVGDFNTVGDAFAVDREFSVRDGGDGHILRYWTEGEGRGDGARDVGRSGDVVHDVLRGGSEVEASNFEGHKKCSWEAGGWMVETTLYLYRVDNDQGGCVSSSNDDA